MAKLAPLPLDRFDGDSGSKVRNPLWGVNTKPELTAKDRILLDPQVRRYSKIKVHPKSTQAILGPKFGPGFASLRKTVDDTVPFSSIRDGSYSAAAAACDEKTAKLFAAHRFGGLMDRYVQRRPDLVKSAAEAVYKKYKPFPAPAKG